MVYGSYGMVWFVVEFWYGMVRTSAIRYGMVRTIRSLVLLGPASRIQFWVTIMTSQEQLCHQVATVIDRWRFDALLSFLYYHTIHCFF